MAAASNESYQLAQFEAEIEAKRKYPQPRMARNRTTDNNAAAPADVVIKHPPPKKPFREQTLGDYNAYLAGVGMKPGVIA